MTWPAPLPSLAPRILFQCTLGRSGQKMGSLLLSSQALATVSPQQGHTVGVLYPSPGALLQAGMAKRATLLSPSQFPLVAASRSLRVLCPDCPCPSLLLGWPFLAIRGGLKRPAASTLLPPANATHRVGLSLLEKKVPSPSSGAEEQGLCPGESWVIKQKLYSSAWGGWLLWDRAWCAFHLCHHSCLKTNPSVEGEEAHQLSTMLVFA